MKGLLGVCALFAVGYRVAQFPRIRKRAVGNIIELQNELDRVTRAMLFANPTGCMEPSDKSVLEWYRDELQKEIARETPYRNGEFVALLFAGKLRTPEDIDTDIWVWSDFDVDPHIALNRTERNPEMKKART